MTNSTEAKLPPTMAPSTELRPLCVLAEQVRENRQLDQDVAVLLDGQEFILRFSQNLYFSAASLEHIDRSRRAANAIPLEPVGMLVARPQWKPAPLSQFLWHLGMLAGEGRSLPWLSSGAAYRLVREPGTPEAAQCELVLQTIRNSGLSPLMIAQQTDLDLPFIFNTLNACSLEGCLTIAPPPAATRTPNPLDELTLQQPYAEPGPEVEQQHRGLLNLFATLQRLDTGSLNTGPARADDEEL